MRTDEEWADVLAETFQPHGVVVVCSRVEQLVAAIRREGEVAGLRRAADWVRQRSVSSPMSWIDKFTAEADRLEKEARDE